MDLGGVINSLASVSSPPRGARAIKVNTHHRHSTKARSFSFGTHCWGLLLWGPGRLRSPPRGHIYTGRVQESVGEKTRPTVPPSSWRAVHALPASKDQFVTASISPFPFQRNLSQHRPPAWLGSRRVGEVPGGSLSWRPHSLGLPRKVDNAFLPGRASPAHFPGRQAGRAGRKHTLTECPMQAGTFAFVSLYPQRRAHLIL